MRVRVEKLAAVARARLDALPEQWKCSMGYDAATNALDEMGGCGVVARSIRKEAHDAIVGRDGWDTWEPRERDNAIARLTDLADAFDALSRELRSLYSAEAVEIERLRAKREANDGDETRTANDP